MRLRIWTAAASVLALCGSLVVHAADTADMVLTNGKIITVDDRFTIAQAVAIKGQRIIAVGKNDDVAKLAAEGAKKIDLKGRAVIPGLIDNHAHWIRAAEHDELRLDGVTTRKEVLKRLSDRVRSSRPGEWIVTLGGWSEEEFTDDPRGFPREELDRIAPDNPVVIQAVYNHSYLNTAALKAAR
ncbi:MAG TPA: amidohydrolase family protein, partial [Burkholderiales bacterium]|nr:amidohydrolase family protein [Burkholderiales bacterium]